MIAHKQTSIATVTELIHNPPMMLILGVVTLAAGLSIVLGHNIWSGGVLPVLVSLVGWITVVKGLLFLFLAPGAMVAVMDALRYAELFYLYMGVSMAIGLCLSVGGFRQRSR
jgi:vacuolar-type H+-ATPase subunit I/STV1